MQRWALPFVVWLILFILSLIFGMPGHINNLCSWRGWLKVSDWGAQQWISGGLILASTVVLIAYLWLQKIKEGKLQIPKPKIDPAESGWDDRGYHGLFLKNVGDIKAYDVVMEPLQMGKYPIEFTGPEVSQLEPGDKCFFHPNAAPAILLKNTPSGCPIFKVLRGWQREMGDKRSAEAKGRIKYKDRNGVDYETRYTIGVDVDANDGLVVRIETGSRK